MENKTIKENDFSHQENVCDVELVFESLSIASDHDLEYLYMDHLINSIRNCPDCEITNLSYDILKKLKMI